MAETKTIDINRCSAQELADAGIPQIDEERARKLVEYRGEKGRFKSWDEVQKVPGFNSEMVQNLQGAGATLGEADEE